MKLNAEAKLNYALPTTVEATRSGWLSTFQSAATVSGLLAAVTAQLLVFFRTNDAFGANGDQKDHPKREAVLTLTYVALILSIGATLSSLILTDEFSDIPIRAARSPYGPESSKTEGDPIFLGKDWEILRTFGLRKSARFVVGHWLLSLLLSSVCTTGSIVVYVISQEQRRTMTIISAAAFFALLPILQFIPSRVIGRRSRDVDSGRHTGSKRHPPNRSGTEETKVEARI